MSALDSQARLSERFKRPDLVIGVIGLGYVGLPLVESFCLSGSGTVIGFDIDPEKISRLEAGESYIAQIAPEQIAAMHRTGRWTPTSDMDRLADADAIIICVPTPLTEHRDPDLRYIESTADQIGQRLRPGQLVILESTTYPFTTRQVVLPRLERGALLHDRDFLLAYSPEREDPGRDRDVMRNVPKLVGGLSDAARRAASAVYRRAFERVIEVSSAEVAEAAKLLENIYRSVNIALINEMKLVLMRMGIDIWEVVDAASTKPFGFSRFEPGPGLGGHCVPIDPFYLSWKAREFGLSTRFIELAGEINHSMPDFVIQRLTFGLNEQHRSVNGSKVLIIGLAYKPNVDDVRESPSVVLIEKLNDLGAKVDYHDPHVPRTRPMRRHNLHMESVALSPEGLAGYDAVLIATHHAAVDWEMIAAHSRLIVDTRGVIRKLGDVRARVVNA